MTRFKDRSDAGGQLAQALAAYANRPEVQLLALPRGGVPIGFEVAKRLRAPLDVFLVRKLGAPGHEELAAGAIASGGIRVVNSAVVAALGLSSDALDAIAKREQMELERREVLYREQRTPLDLAQKIVVLLDDGFATGATMRAAVEAVRRAKPARVVVAVPVGSSSACRELAELADEVVCLLRPASFWALSQWYDTFSQTSDDEVKRLLRAARDFVPGHHNQRLGRQHAEGTLPESLWVTLIPRPAIPTKQAKGKPSAWAR